MNDTYLDQRENRVLDFINTLNNKNNVEKQHCDIMNDPNVKFRNLSKCRDHAKSDCINTILGKVYRDALPFDDPDKCCSSDVARDKVKDFIAARTGGKTSEWYVKEAIRKTNSPMLKTLDTGANQIVNELFREKSKDVSKLNVADMDFHIKDDDDNVQELSKKMELDDISEIIRSNVENDIRRETEKSKAEAEYTKQIEDNLTNDPSVIDDQTMEAAIEKIKRNNFGPSVYQPSLFEAVMIHNTEAHSDCTMSDVMSESVHEYTMLNITKALKLESFNLSNIKRMANNYIR